jgi:hypothetical protein
MCENFDELLARREVFDLLPYPLTVFTARYGGTYEGGQCIAVNEHPGHPVLSSASDSDIECANWYATYEQFKPIGRGRSHSEAIYDLAQKLAEEPHKAWPEFLWGDPEVWW